MTHQGQFFLVSLALCALVSGSACTGGDEPSPLKASTEPGKVKNEGSEGATEPTKQSKGASEGAGDEAEAVVKSPEAGAEEEGAEALEDEDTRADEEDERAALGCLGSDKEAVGLPRPAAQAPKSSIDDAAWLKADAEDPCADPKSCQLVCPEGAQLVKTKYAHHCMLHGKKYGPSASWYESGILKAKGAYLGGHKHGPWVAWHPNGRREGMATHDAKNGKLRRSFVSRVESFEQIALVESPGRRAWTSHYNEASRRDGEAHYWDRERGTLHVINYRDGERHGPFRVFTSSGELVFEQIYKEGKAQGHKRAWSSAGWMTLDMSYEDDLPVGRRRMWSGRCELSQVDHWKRGKLDGEVRMWHSYPSRLSERANYKEGERHGLSETWNSAGLLVRKHEHRAGKRHGESSGWYANTQRAFETYWLRGRPDKSVRAWHASGAPALKGSYVEGRKVSLSCFDVDGKRASCSEIKPGIWDEW